MDCIRVGPGMGGLQITPKSPPISCRKQAGFSRYAYRKLFNFARTFFAVSFPCQCFFGTAFLSRLQIKRMPFDFFNDIFLLDFALEPAQGAF